MHGVHFPERTTLHEDNKWKRISCKIGCWISVCVDRVTLFCQKQDAGPLSKDPGSYFPRKFFERQYRQMPKETTTLLDVGLLWY